MVSDSGALEEALEEAEAGQTIELQPGDYQLPRLSLHADGEPDAPITVQSALPGQARIWSDNVTLIKLYGAHWHFRGIDFQGMGNAIHALHIVRDADHVVVEGNRFQNFHAAIKANGEGSPRTFPDHARIHRNVFTNDTPRDTDESVVAIDIVGGRDWTITENFISDIGYDPNIRGRNTTTAFVKGGAQQATFDRNVVICEWQHEGGYRAGMSFGGGGTGEAQTDRRGMEDCEGGCPEVRNSRMTNNIILNCPNSAGIYLNQAQDVLVANNTVYDAYGIIAHLPETRARIQDNLITGRVWTRRDAEVDTVGNLASGWPNPAGVYLPSARMRLHAPPPEDGERFTEGIDTALDWATTQARGVLDWFGASRLAKGVSRYEGWLVAPEFGQLQPQDPEPLLGQGYGGQGVEHDFCGQPRTGAVDIGAIQYSAGDCNLQEELVRRHGELFTDLSDEGRHTPQTPAAAQRDADDPLEWPAPARTLSATPENLAGRVAELRPGDELELAPGAYRGGLDLRGLEGTADQPIVIRGPEPDAGQERAVLVGESGRNTIRFQNSAHIVLKDLELDGRRQNVNAVVAEAPGDYTHDITLDGLYIHGYDSSRGNTGITTRSAAWNWILRNNEIRRVGTGLYLGQPDGGAPFIAGVIEGNDIAETRGYAAQIKHQQERPIISGMPTEPMRTVIRGNTFSKAEGGDSGSGARPNLLVGHFPREGPGRHDQYLIHSNLFYENPHERLFQGEGHVALYNNLFVSRGGQGMGGDGAIFLRHNDVPKDLFILNNTFVTTGFGLRIDEPDTDYEQMAQGNAIFSPEPLRLDGIEAPDNYTAGFEAAREQLVNVEGDREELDLTPRAGALERGVGLPPPEADLPGLDRDHRGNERTRNVWGALLPAE